MTAAIILAGGKSSRMKTDKLRLEYGGETLLARAVRRFSSCFDTVRISVAGADKYPEFSDIALPDLLPGHGPLSGLHAALTAFPGGVFLFAADMPFAEPSAALKIIARAAENRSTAAAVFLPDGRCEPLFAYYTAAVLPDIAAAIQRGDNKLANLLSGRPDVLHISPDSLGTDCEKLFMNVNRPDDYESLLRDRF